MAQFDALGVYLRFVVWLAVGLFAFSVFAGGVIDQFFTTLSLRDYRLARLRRLQRRAVKSSGSIQIEDVSLSDLASQLTYGRRGRSWETKRTRSFSRKSYRGQLVS